MTFSSNQVNYCTNDSLLCATKALAKTPLLSVFLSAKVLNYSLFVSKANAKAVLAWGRKPSAQAAEALADKLQLPILRLEDGFLRSVLLGNESPPYSIVVDDIGIYYDASRPSRLEHLIQQPLTSAEHDRATRLISMWQKFRLSKYNHSREGEPPCNSPYVLVVDQTFGDAAIEFGAANANSFQQMLEKALQFYPEHTIVLKIHPDVFTGTKKSHFNRTQLESMPRVLVLSDDVHPVSVIEHADAIFCVTSQMGFEALLWNKPVFCFGMPFYAGWGLTQDSLSAPIRRSKVSLTQLVHAALVNYPRYINPDTQQMCEVEELMSWIALQKQHRGRFNNPLYLVKPPVWKQQIFRRFLQGAQVVVLEKHQQPPVNASLVGWGVQTEDNYISVEDGFIRSVGLGADLTKPLSWVFDPIGIYYDATRPSWLEYLLQNQTFTLSDTERAAELIHRLIALKMTKYNIGTSSWKRPTDQRVILVPGQVESDASIKFGSPVLKTNLALLKAVRAANPDAYIVYKPHPDVQAGLRLAGAADQEPREFCDVKLGDEDMAHLLTQVDEVHTLTSLTGFEALIRGISVICYGQPFYAGWGLTKDIYPPERRTRQLTLHQLVAGTLIHYPTYINWHTGCFTTVEQTILEIERLKSNYRGVTLWQRIIRQILRLKRF